MAEERNIILDSTQIDQRINRIAYQIYEDNQNEKEIVLVGIKSNGYKFAEKICDALKKISKLKVKLGELTINKKDQVNAKVAIDGEIGTLSGMSVVLADDVLNSGKTIVYSMKALLESDAKKIRTALLVDRDHKSYPVMADFVGMSLSTTMQEHVTVEFGKRPRVYLS